MTSAKSRLSAFQLLPKTPDIGTVGALGQRYKDQLTWVRDASPDKDLTVGYLKHFGVQLAFYVFYHGECRGTITFDFLEGRSLGRKYGVRLKNLATPHSVLDPVLRRKGIARFLYLRALNSGMVFITDQHTEMAAKLWDTLATLPRIKLYHYEAGVLVPQATNYSTKVLKRI